MELVNQRLNDVDIKEPKPLSLSSNEDRGSRHRRQDCSSSERGGAGSGFESGTEVRHLSLLTRRFRDSIFLLGKILAGALVADPAYLLLQPMLCNKTKLLDA